MFIRVEPKDFFMYSVQLIFDLDEPNSEDQPVRDYLAEHELEPKYRQSHEWDGHQCDSMWFGGCYLGRHLDRIGQIQRHAVEVDLLTAEVERHLTALVGDVGVPEARRQETVSALVQDFHQESSFQTNENGELIAVLDGDAVRAAARQRLAGLLHS